ncbi:hypothetical protein FGB62_130g138 [Gracilaria domingensis]|nr:hypothetical protein FGB62_130g138 [Gracilaria domingensis]
MISVLQLRRSDVPQLVFPDGKDVFQLLWCPTQDHEDAAYGPLSKTFWRNSKAIHNVLKRAPQDFIDEGEQCIPHECRLQIEEVEEYPPLHSLNAKQQKAIKKYIEQHGQDDISAVNGSMDDEAYYSLFEPAPMSKVGGYVSWIQDAETFCCAKCGTIMHHLLTISSTEIGEDGSRWNVMFSENGQLVEDEMREQFDTGLCLGDMGSYYVMVCRTCEDRPIQVTFQCS